MKPVPLAQAAARYLRYRTQFGFQLDHDRLYLHSLVRFARRVIIGGRSQSN
ncbi:MAG: hypothetical protein WCO56_29555 [Verrucomicrobiota bacterium]